MDFFLYHIDFKGPLLIREGEYVHLLGYGPSLHLPGAADRIPQFGKVTGLPDPNNDCGTFHGSA
jgi:hypothetical protein